MHRARECCRHSMGSAQLLEFLSRRGEIWVEAEGLLELFDGFAHTTLSLQGVSEIIMRFDVIWVESQRLFPMLLRFGHPSGLGQCDPQIVVGLRIVGIEAQCFLVMRDCLRHFALCQ